MPVKTIIHNFSGKKVDYYFDAGIDFLEQLVSKKDAIIITDENVFAKHAPKFSGWNTIVLQAGEQHKQQSTVDYIISELIKLEAGRSTFVVGVGGGVITDITGYAAGIYMRGLKFGFVPTTILAMVDASIGGKNGVDVGTYKNLAGLIKQPEFLLFDYSLLQTLPKEQWVNGFAEIIKHACIKDATLFAELEAASIEDYMQDANKLANLIEKNVAIKTTVVMNDEFEQGDRKLLNFGHTMGHAIENMYQMLHGHAVSIGMVAACTISEEINAFPSQQKEAVIHLLQQYHLPVTFQYNKQKIWEILKMDKKRELDKMNFILLNKIGEGVVQKVPLVQLENLFSQSL